VDKPGIRRIIERLRAMGTLSSEQAVDACFDLVGPVQPAERTRAALVRHVEKTGPLDLERGGRAAEERVGELLQMVVSTRELQWV
jgi:hypothetical protein